MSNLIRAELLKLRTLRSFWWYVASALAFVPVSIAQAIYSGTASLDTSEGVRNVMAASSSGGVILLLIGILAMAGEFRHNTATPTFLVTPDRTRVVRAKLAAASIAGVCVAAVASLLTLAIAIPWLQVRDVDVSLLSGDVGFVLLGAVIATALAPLVGIGVGALVPNQTVAVTVMLVWTFVVESLLVAFMPGIGRWLPGGAASALTGVETPNGGLLPMWAGVLVFAGYAFAFSAIGTRFVVRRDVT
jgi:ABC-2 type transport system permease protein